MPDSNVIPSILPEGLLIKTAGDHFKVLRDGKLVDVLGEAMGTPPPSAASGVFSPSRPVAEKPTAAYFYAAEDDAEIQKHAEGIKGLERPTFDVRSTVTKLASQFGLSFPDETLKNRFRRIVEMRLRDVRDDLETIEMLSRPTKVGGMSFPQGVAERILDALQPEVENIHRLKPAVTRQPAPDIQRPPVPRVSTPLPPVPKPGIPIPPIPRGSSPGPIAAARPPLPTPLLVRPKATPPLTLPVAPIAARPKPTPPPPSAPPRMQRPTIRPDKPVVEDIRRPSKLVGPVEELQEMTLEDFRRLGKTPSEAVKKVRERIQTLGEESFSRGVEGINAWRQSPIHRLYLEVGRQSMDTGRTIAEVVRERLAQDPNGMTQEEFLAVLHLNKQLRF